MASGDPDSQWVEVEASSNIALIKYWGKRDEELILPINDSISLSIDDVFARTKLRIGHLGKDSVSINGKMVDLKKSSRFDRCFNEARRLLRKRKLNGEEHSTTTVHFEVSSTTNFPVAAGLASSAAGFAAIAFAMGKLFDFNEKEVSRIARIGSGSACRSVLDGLVRWRAGEEKNGGDCYAERLFPSSHWSSLRAIIIVLNEAEKDIGSTVGMQTTVRTSHLLPQRLQILPNRIERLIAAFEHRDFPCLAEEIMRDSNQFHSVCLDTWPPLKYLSDSSWSIIRLIQSFNSEVVRAAYTFDAGPNACIYLEKDSVVPFLLHLSSTVSIPTNIVDKVRISCDGEFVTELKNWSPSPSSFVLSVQDIIVSTVGGGPRVIGSSERC